MSLGLLRETLADERNSTNLSDSDVDVKPVAKKQAVAKPTATVTNIDDSDDDGECACLTY